METKTILIIAGLVVAYLLLSSPAKTDDLTGMNMSMAKQSNKSTNISNTLEKNFCGYTSYGYPNYAGTDKENLTCADAWPDQQNMECLLHPPADYDGTVIVIDRISDPVLTCCQGDGSCQWVPKSK